MMALVNLVALRDAPHEQDLSQGALVVSNKARGFGEHIEGQLERNI